MAQAVVSKGDCNYTAAIERQQMPSIADSDPVISRHKTIGLLDHLGGGNLGDDATLLAAMQNIKSRWPDAEIVGLSMNPDDTQRRHGIAAYPIRRKTWSLGNQALSTDATIKGNVKSLLRKWPCLFGAVRAIHTVVLRLPTLFFQELAFLARSFRRLQALNILVISGGGQLTDWFGTWNFPYTIFTWVLLGRLARARCIFLNVGAGPLTRPLSKFFVRGALACAHYVSFRDERSRALARSIGFRGPAHVFPDCVYALESRSLDMRTARRREKTSVGLAPMPFYDPRSVYPAKDQGLYDNFIHTLSSFGKWLVRNNYELTLWCSDIGVDPPAIEDLRISICGQIASSDQDYLAIPTIKTIEDLLRVMWSLDYIITCRFHGVVLAHMLNIPIIALSHHPKIDTLMVDLGLAEYCLDIHTADDGALKAAFASMVANRERIQSRMAKRSALYRNQLVRQFDQIIGYRIECPRVQVMEHKSG
jgi:polysaccharide pyruvyl transferase WcaK-like protein